MRGGKCVVCTMKVYEAIKATTFMEDIPATVVN